MHTLCLPPVGFLSNTVIGTLMNGMVNSTASLLVAVMVRSAAITSAVGGVVSFPVNIPIIPLHVSVALDFPAP